jgi:hypothetical protein
MRAILRGAQAKSMQGCSAVNCGENYCGRGGYFPYDAFERTRARSVENSPPLKSPPAA